MQWSSVLRGEETRRRHHVQFSEETFESKAKTASRNQLDVMVETLEAADGKDGSQGALWGVDEKAPDIERRKKKDLAVEANRAECRIGSTPPRRGMHERTEESLWSPADVKNRFGSLVLWHRVMGLTRVSGIEL